MSLIFLSIFFVMRASGLSLAEWVASNGGQARLEDLQCAQMGNQLKLDDGTGSPVLLKNSWAQTLVHGALAAAVGAGDDAAVELTLRECQFDKDSKVVEGFFKKVCSEQFLRGLPHQNLLYQGFHLSFVEVFALKGLGKDLLKYWQEPLGKGQDFYTRELTGFMLNIGLRVGFDLQSSMELFFQKFEEMVEGYNRRVEEPMRISDQEKTLFQYFCFGYTTDFSHRTIFVDPFFESVGDSGRQAPELFFLDAYRKGFLHPSKCRTLMDSLKNLLGTNDCTHVTAICYLTDQVVTILFYRDKQDKLKYFWLDSLFPLGQGFNGSHVREKLVVTKALQVLIAGIEAEAAQARDKKEREYTAALQDYEDPNARGYKELQARHTREQGKREILAQVWHRFEELFNRLKDLTAQHVIVMESELLLKTEEKVEAKINTKSYPETSVGLSVALKVKLAKLLVYSRALAKKTYSSWRARLAEKLNQAKGAAKRFGARTFNWFGYRLWPSSQVGLLRLFWCQRAGREDLNSRE